MAMAMPRPVTLDDITYVFEPGRKCMTIYGTRHHSPDTPPAWWKHQHDRSNVGRYYVDMADPVTVRVRICACRGCDHAPLGDLDAFRDAFMEHRDVAFDLKYRRDVKQRAHAAHGERTRAAAALAACDGVETAALTPGLLKRLLEEAPR